MSQFANSADTAPASASTYSRDLLALLGDRDPWTVWEELVPAVEVALADLTPRDLRQPERSGKWSALEVLCHLVDTEVVYRYRMRRIVAQPGSAIEGYDQDAWARELGYADADPVAELALLATLRAANLSWLRSLDNEALDRSGEHSERGTESVRTLVSLLAAHDLVHRAQLGRIRRAIGRDR